MLLLELFAFFLVFSCTPASSVNAGSFRSDYYFIAEANGWFKLHLIPANWRDARLRCHLEGAVLASPLDESIQRQMVKMIKYDEFFELRTFFTGIHAFFSKGDFFSIEGVPLSEMPHEWAPTEPNNEGDDESCIAMYSNGTVADVSCNGVHQFACYRQYKEELVLNECGTIDNEYKLAKETGKCYKFHRTPRDWSRAFMACAAEGGHLAIINSIEEASVLSKIFYSIPLKEIKIVKGLVLAYIGFHDWGEHGDWLTIHGQTLQEAGYSNWGKAFAEPNNLTTADTHWDGEYCGSIYQNAEFNDFWCDYAISFICEKEPMKPS